MPPACTLPPLILHPFSNAAGPSKLVDASRASLVLQGLLPTEGSVVEMEQRLLEGRYCELTMLFYLGKDLVRWTSQCVEMVNRNGENESGIRPESFATLLVEDPPPKVLDKLRIWGVHEHKSIFTRAFGLHALFEVLPDCECLTPEFVRHYHRFADQMFACQQQLFQFQRLRSADFEFQLFASGEYTKMLEAEWGTL
jgi:hypothetical protein